MARTNMNATRVKPARSRLHTLHVRRTARISPNIARVTLGGGDIDAFVPMGYDQWFRLFLPVSENSLSRLPNKLDTFAYLRFLAIAKTDRPVLRNYTVRAFRPDGPDGPELDIDFVLHGSAAAGTSGPAATWAETCAEGDAVALLDEGIAFNPPPQLAGRVILVGDETALPAIAGIVASLSRETVGTAYVEVPHADDAQELDAPPGVDVRWVARTDPHATPGLAVRAAVEADAVPTEPVYAWVAGEQSLVVDLRRHWVRAGVPKDAISFTGYWRAAAHH
jgi:NADPH-dependent ferric siderophore reductase